MREELPHFGRDHNAGPPPPPVRAMRAFGFAAIAFMVFVAVTTEPRPALHGDGALVLLALVALLAGLPGVFPRRPLPPGRRLVALTLVGAASVALTALQTEGAAISGVYLVPIIAALRLPRAQAVAVSALTIGGEMVALALTHPAPTGPILTLGFSMVPWFLVMRLMRQQGIARARAEGLVEELRESREAHAQSAALGERTRLARDMHDVLAHSLSALSLQLEAARLLARDRDADPDVVAAVERAHHLAAGGLDEARRAIAALRGDELPGPERLQALADAFREHTAADCRLTVSGEPRPLGSEARLAIYRTAQEALTNVRRHSAADRVELVLAYEAGGTRLTVRDHGPGAPVAVGGGPGGGYGLTGMRERAELLGGRLAAGPTDDGFQVELWLPA
jgi:signal transduction histidine kinase